MRARIASRGLWVDERVDANYGRHRETKQDPEDRKEQRPRRVLEAFSSGLLFKERIFELKVLIAAPPPIIIVERIVERLLQLRSLLIRLLLLPRAR